MRWTWTAEDLRVQEKPRFMWPNTATISLDLLNIMSGTFAKYGNDGFAETVEAVGGRTGCTTILITVSDEEIQL